MKNKETLEEAAKQYAEIYRCPATNDNEYCRHDIISAINFGAKWQQEQDKNKYSEEDMILYSDYVLLCSAEKTFKLPLQPKQWFEQFKKK